MPDVTLPHTFVNGVGNVIDANQVNANFVALRDAVNDLGIDNLSSALRQLLIPTGTPLLTLGDTADPGFLMADGAFVSQATYAALFAKVGHKCNGGVDPGDGTFKLPNLKGRVPVGRDAAQPEFDTLGETGGAKAHTLATSEIPAHAHADGSLAAASVASGSPFITTNANMLALEVQAPAATGWRVPGNFGSPVFDEYDFNHAHDVTGSTSNAGGGGSHNNLQPFQVFNWQIKT